MKKKIRVLLAKGGLDGHDRGMQIVAQALRDAGLEVVYGGLYQSPEEIVNMALQENTDIVGISIHTGAHIEIFSEVLRLFKEKINKNWLIFGGGIIPKEDISILESMGVKRIFLPGADTKDMVKFISEAIPMVKKDTETRSLYDLIERAQKGDVLSASQLMTEVQQGNKAAKILIAEFLLPEKEFFSIGVTGSGGVGKSSLINRLIRVFREEGKTVGVVAHDPISVSGGAFLGDRIRMQEHTLDQGVFIRSLAQYKNFKGVTPETPYIAKIMGLMGKDVIILETVGAGQGDAGFKELTETLIWVTMPGLGDEIQTLKGGGIETADIIVVNKSDKVGGDLLFQNLQNIFGDKKIICKTNSLAGEGIPRLAEAIKEHKKSLQIKAA